MVEIFGQGQSPVSSHLKLIYQAVVDSELRHLRIFLPIFKSAATSARWAAMIRAVQAASISRILVTMLLEQRRAALQLLWQKERARLTAAADERRIGDELRSELIAQKISHARQLDVEKQRLLKAVALQTPTLEKLTTLERSAKAQDAYMAQKLGAYRELGTLVQDLLLRLSEHEASFGQVGILVIITTMFLELVCYRN